MKVYCKDCKYFFKGDPPILPATCYGFDKMKKSNATGLNVYECDYDECHNYNENNKNNDCNNFMPKWYLKFKYRNL